MRRILLGLLAMVCCLTLAAPALAEVAFLPMISLRDLETMPLELTLSAEVTAYAPFGEDRLPQLTNLMKHLALHITWQPLIDETQSTVAVLVDGEEALSLGLQETAQGGMAQFSVLPNTTYAGADPLSLLLGMSPEPLSIFGIDGSESAWLEEGYELLNAIGEGLASYRTGESKIKTEIKNMGTARLKQDYTIPKSETEGLSALLAGLCPEGRLKELISGLVFSGKQTLRVYRDADDAPLRIEWTGNCGVDEDHLRDVTFTWRLRRDDTAYRDEVTLTSPALRGSDNNRLTWNCAIAPNKSGQMVLSGNLSYTRTENKQKTILTGEYKLTSEDEGSGTRVTGSATISQQLPGADKATGYTFEPNLLFTGDSNIPAMEGTLTVSSLLGKTTLDQAIITLDMRRTGYTSWQMRQETVNLSLLDAASQEAARDQVTSAISSAFIRRLALLPREDLDYLFMDLPEETVQAIISAAQSD
ncbi:MAG: hypothetical protein J1E43_00655 [Christensenellaceae bacterium]|nr:hypothetical protein [Christensenellaceae bacterium]